MDFFPSLWDGSTNPLIAGHIAFYYSGKENVVHRCYWNAEVHIDVTEMLKLLHRQIDSVGSLS